MAPTITPLSRHDGNTKERGSETSKRRKWNHTRKDVFVSDLRPWSELPESGRVFVVGMPRSQELDRWLGVALADVNVFHDGHYPVVHGPGRMVTDAGTWWPDLVDADLMARAWRWLEIEIRRSWNDPDVCLLATPGTTGRDLWLRMPAADGCPIMSDEAQTLVRTTSGQGRIETFRPRSHLVPALYEYDLRLAYAAVLRNLPMGEPDEVSPATDVGRLPYRALVRFRPPDGWRHVGIIGQHHGAAGWSFPTVSSWHGPAWADGCEIELARRHGWAVEFERVIVWPKFGDPLRAWADRLLPIIDTAQRVLSPDGARYVRSMVRSIILHTIGAFHGAPARVTCTAPDLADAPIGVDSLRIHDDGHVSWRETRPARWPEAVHPEWSAHIWARNRVRLLATPKGGGMLTVDPTTLVAVRTDAVYTTTPTGWDADDDGKPGRWVLKHVDECSQPWPRTGADVLVARARKGSR